ncbi:hypothetical protein SAMN02745866_04301 [Alteromonadaceae bacterium Bs31]|nr:hypothetical protein SAMN02745866_04301 [Alteromonadaceae bacterium Bs31]
MKRERERNSRDESITWVLLVILVISFFLYQWNTIYTTVTGYCVSPAEFWTIKTVRGWSIYEATFWLFFLIGALSCIELLRGLGGLVSDAVICVPVNVVIIICVSTCLHVIGKQYNYIETEWSTLEYSYIYPTPHVDSQAGYLAFDEFIKNEYCKGAISKRYVLSVEAHNRLKSKFVRSGKVRAGMK